jgi:hypothetical protein
MARGDCTIGCEGEPVVDVGICVDNTGSCVSCEDVASTGGGFGTLGWSTVGGDAVRVVRAALGAVCMSGGGTCMVCGGVVVAGSDFGASEWAVMDGDTQEAASVEGSLGDAVKVGCLAAEYACTERGGACVS